METLLALQVQLALTSWALFFEIVRNAFVKSERTRNTMAIAVIVLLIVSVGISIMSV